MSACLYIRSDGGSRFLLLNPFAMADTSADLPQSRKHRRTPRPIRLDMTPLVDLAFLLLSFFVVTTTLRHEQVMALVFPAPGPGLLQIIH